MVVLLLMVFVSISLMYYIVMKIIFQKKNDISRLKKYTNIGYEEKTYEKKNEKDVYKSGIKSISNKVGNVKFLEGYKKSVQSKLVRANILLKPEEFITMTFIIVLIPSFLVLVITGNIIITLVVGLIFWIIPGLVLQIKIKRRLKYLNDQLGDAIALISNSLKAGYSFLQAVETVAEEMNGPIAEEFYSMKKEINFGLSTEAAMEKLSERIKSDDLDLMITAVLIQRQIGGNLAEILDNISTTIRERVRIKGEIKTLTAQGRMSGMVISFMPPVLFVIIYFINNEFMSILFKDPIGYLIIGFSIIMEFIGIMAIKKIVNIEI